MTISTNLNIHPDFRFLKGRKAVFKPWPLALANCFISFFSARRAAKYKTVISREAITGVDGNRIPLLIIRPENLSSPSPALVYYHGGAFVYKHAPAHIDNAVRYARDAQCVVVFVDYRLAPKHPFPAGFDDCYAALLFALANANQLGIDKQRIAVGGDSAGGTMAAGVAQKAHENDIKLCGQMLVYPGTDTDLTRPSVTAFASVPPFKELSYLAVWENYLGHPLAIQPGPYAVPLQGRLAGLAPAYVETCEFDLLRDEGNAYADALADKGVKVELNATKQTIHGFDLFARSSEVSKVALARRIDFLREIFG